MVRALLSDRLLKEITKTIAERDMAAQALDNMDLEREKGSRLRAMLSS